MARKYFQMLYANDKFRWEALLDTTDMAYCIVQSND